MGTYAGLRVFDVSDAVHPVMAGSLGTDGIGSLVVRGNYLYATGNDGIQVIDVQTPQNPVLISRFALTDHPNELVSANSYLYFTALAENNDQVLRVYSLANPALPAPTGVYTLTSGTSAWSLAVEGGRAHLGEHPGAPPNGIRILNVADPAHPVAIGFWASEGEPNDIASSGNLVYLADGSGGLSILNVQNPTLPTRVGTISPKFSALTSVAVNGRYAGVNDSTGLKIIDLAEEPGLQIGASLALTGTAGEVEWQDGYAYLIRGSSMAIVELASPLQPQKRGVFTASETLGDVIIDGDLAYVSGASGLRVLNVSNKAAPTQVGFLSLPDMGSWNDNLAREAAPCTSTAITSCTSWMPAPLPRWCTPEPILSYRVIRMVISR